MPARDQRSDLERALDELRWADDATRPALLRLLRHGFQEQLWPLLDGEPQAGPSSRAALRPLLDVELDDLLRGFEPFLRDLAAARADQTDAKDPFMLSDVEKLLFLRALPLFRDVELSELQRLVDTCEVHRYRAGERVFEQGEDGDMLFLITAGRVVVVAGMLVPNQTR